MFGIVLRNMGPGSKCLCAFPSGDRHARQANEIPPALKARVRGTRDSKAQGEGREAAEALGWSDLGKALKGRSSPCLQEIRLKLPAFEAGSF